VRDRAVRLERQRDGALGVRDVDMTAAGLVFALGSAIFAGAGTLAMFLWPAAAPRVGFGKNVWFWWNGEWRPAPPFVEVAPLAPPSLAVRAAALGVSGVGFVVAVSGLVSWLDTVESVTIAFDEPRAVTVRVDGAAEEIPNHPPTSHDVRFYGFTVRTGRLHRIEVTANGETRTYEIDATRKGHGWLLAATARPVCFVEEKAVYGTSVAEPERHVLRPDASGVITLPRRYDRKFSPPPVLAKTSNGAASKWALRATACDAATFAEGKIIPYRENTATTGATIPR